MLSKAVETYRTLSYRQYSAHRKDRHNQRLGAIVYADGKVYRGMEFKNLEIFDRVGGGGSFASDLSTDL